MFAMNISHEYLLKSRRLTWENAEVIDNLFGPIAFEVKIENWKETYRQKSTDGSISNSLTSQQVCQRGYKKTKKKIHVHLDYQKMISVRVSIAPVNLNVDTKQPSRHKSISFSKGNHPIDASPSKPCQGDDGNACTICHKKFAFKSVLTRHLRTHTGDKPYSCPQCEKRFSQKGHLKKHSLIHFGRRDFSCDICHKSFRQKSHLTVHRRTHTGDKPFKCTVCNAMFSGRSNLNIHMRTHTGEAPYQCEICEKNFTRLGTLTRHLLIHCEEKPFACTYANCVKAFRLKGDLQIHVRVHTKDKPYACPKCHKTFSQSGNCRTHTKRCSVMKSVSADDSFNT